jgi:hypothetical protein
MTSPTVAASTRDSTSCVPSFMPRTTLSMRCFARIATPLYVFWPNVTH